MSFISFDNIVKILTKYWDKFLIDGVGYTLLLSAITVFFGAILASLLAGMKMSRIAPLRWLSAAYIEISFETDPFISVCSFFYSIMDSFCKEIHRFLYGSSGISPPDHPCAQDRGKQISRTGIAAALFLRCHPGLRCFFADKVADVLRTIFFMADARDHGFHIKFLYKQAADGLEIFQKFLS